MLTHLKLNSHIISHDNIRLTVINNNNNNNGKKKQSQFAFKYTHTHTEIHMVSALANSHRPVELQCLVDQQNCGEVYYITWTKQVASLNPSQNSSTITSSSSSSSSNSNSNPNSNSNLLNMNQQQQHWTRVYLYTGSNDSMAHKPIGDLVSRAQFIMPNENNVKTTTTTTTNFTSDSTSTLTTTINNNLAKLVIDEPRQSDEALYKCDVTYVKGKCPSISLVRLQILAMPSKARIYSLQTQANSIKQQQLTPLNDGQLVGPYLEQQQLRLRCSLEGGKPAPRLIIWRKIDSQSGRIVNLVYSSKLNHFDGSSATSSSPFELDLNHTLTSADLGAKFECHIEHEAIDLQVAFAGNNNNNNKPENTQSNNHNNLNDDSMLDLHPSTSNNNELSSSTTDESNGFDLRRQLDSHVQLDLQVGVSSLDLFMSKINQGKTTATTMPTTIKEADLIELECVAYGSRPAANISWFNGQELIEQQDNALINNKRHKRLLQRQQVHKNQDNLTYNTQSFLSIKLSRHENGAQISCRAENVAMKQASVKTLELQVQRK